MKKTLAEFAQFEIKDTQAVTGGCCTCYCEPPPKKKEKGNNGFGNGGNDPAPGNSGHNKSHNAGQKLEDQVR